MICTDAGADGACSARRARGRAGRARSSPRADDDLAALLYTGGTTGRAKGVMLSHANLHYVGSAAYAASHVAGVNRSLVTLPLSHAYGLLVTVVGLSLPSSATSPCCCGGSIRTRSSTLIEEHRLQQTAVVPSMLQALLAKPLEDYDLSSLRHVTSGASPLSPETEREFTAPRAVGLDPAGLRADRERRAGRQQSRRPRARRVGRAAGARLRGRDPRSTTATRCRAGEVGEICVRSPGVMLGYWHAPETTADAIRDGWLHTGDVGRLDEDGYLYIVDRIKDLIIRGGFNVYPRDVEDALRRAPGGRDGRRSSARRRRRHGEEVVAFVSLRPGADARARAADRLGARADRRLQVPAPRSTSSTRSR